LFQFGFTKNTIKTGGTVVTLVNMNNGRLPFMVMKIFGRGIPVGFLFSQFSDEVETLVIT
jgi:hypothetical protein